MKRIRIITFTSACLAAFLIPAHLRAAEAEPTVAFSELPAAATKSIAQQAEGGKIGKLSREDHDGKTACGAVVTSNGKKREISVDPAGKLLSIEEAIKLSEAPEAVHATIAKESAGGKVKTVERVQEGGKLIYEALVLVKGKEREIEISPKGKVVGSEEKKAGEKD